MNQEPETYDVIVEVEATEQLANISAYIAAESTPSIAMRFVDQVLDHALGLATFPKRGTQRDDIRLGLRTVSFKKRVTIAFTVDDNSRTVSVIGFFYGGQDWQTIIAASDT